MTDPSLRDLPSRYKVVFCDLWGCVHDGVAAFPGAIDLLRDWRLQGRTVILVTNAPRPVDAVAAQLTRVGVSDDAYDAIVSSGAVGIDYAKQELADRQLGFIGSSADLATLRAQGLMLASQPIGDAIICTGFREEHQNDLTFYEPILTDLASLEKPLLCFNPDRVVHRGGQPELCAGALAELFEKLGGKAIWFGKPHRPIYDRCIAVASQLRGEAISTAEVIAVGDSVRTDLWGAANAGIASVFVAGGIEKERFATTGPDEFFASLTGFGDYRPICWVNKLQ